MLKSSRRVEGFLLVLLSVCGITKDNRFQKSSDVIWVILILIIIIIIIIVVTLVLISVIEGVKLKISEYFFIQSCFQNRSQKDYQRIHLK
jgi:uncharacterized membrane protein affecting hemolysin expression